jgi:hypothetical protein
VQTNLSIIAAVASWSPKIAILGKNFDSNEKQEVT